MKPLLVCGDLWQRITGLHLHVWSKWRTADISRQSTFDIRFCKHCPIAQTRKRSFFS